MMSAGTLAPVPEWDCVPASCAWHTEDFLK